MNREQKKWLDTMGTPSYPITGGQLTLLTRYEEPECDIELYAQPNGGGTVQRLMMVFPKDMRQPCPAVAVPFYFPEAMLGYEPATGEKLPYYAGVEMMLHLARRGYVAASADAYHLTYRESEKDRGDFSRWQDAGEALRRDHPNWSGMGKLVSDTKLLVDALAADPRVEPERIGIAGHSLGGKMAFYTGCLDDRIRVILASDMGLGWDQTNWRDIWYWGDQVDALMADGMDHAGLLGAAAPKPFCLIAGEFDDERSWELMCRAPGYEPSQGRLKIINHATGHRPPRSALEEGYRFLDHWLR